MPDGDIVDLMRRSGFSFIGTVQRLGASTMPDVPVDDRTAVLRVDQVLHTPPAFTQLAGMSVTVQLDAGAAVPNVGEQVAIFGDATAFGDSIALQEVGRATVESLAPQLTAGATMGAGPPLADLAAQAAVAELREHAASADAVVVGRVTGLAKAGPTRIAEHDPDWWLATLEVDHVESGPVQPGPVNALYANSLDVRWRQSPKPKASQEGVWLLHATSDDLRQLAPWQMTHQEDYQPVEHLDGMREQGGPQP